MIHHTSATIHIADLPLLLPARKDLMIHSTSGETSSSAIQDSRTLSCQEHARKASYKNSDNGVPPENADIKLFS